MLITTFASYIGVDVDKIHPKFHHFDALVTILVFLDIAHRIVVF